MNLLKLIILHIHGLNSSHFVRNTRQAWKFYSNPYHYHYVRFSPNLWLIHISHPISLRRVTDAKIDQNDLQLSGRRPIN